MQVGSGDHALICVTELIQHTIDEGNRLFADTPFLDDQLKINSDRLAAWWEAEAQQYLEERGYKDRQVRAWALPRVGGRRQARALCARLMFGDLDCAIDKNIIRTSSLPVGDSRRRDDGTQKQLASAMRRSWAHTTTSERIVEDMKRYKIEKIIELKGGVVPDFGVQHAGCSRRKRKVTAESRMYSPPPEVATIVAEQCKQLRAKAEGMLSPVCEHAFGLF